MGFLRTSTTRIAGALSLLALAAVTVSDFLLTDFWDRNAMATSVVADVFVLMVGVAVVNEFLAARSRRRWQLVADLPSPVKGKRYPAEPLDREEVYALIAACRGTGPLAVRNRALIALL